MMLPSFDAAFAPVLLQPPDQRRPKSPLPPPTASAETGSCRPGPRPDVPTQPHPGCAAPTKLATPIPVGASGHESSVMAAYVRFHPASPPRASSPPWSPPAEAASSGRLQPGLVAKGPAARFAHGYSLPPTPPATPPDWHNHAEGAEAPAGPAVSSAAASPSCAKCGKVFKTSLRLARHERYCHSSAKPYQCRKCPKSFKTASNLSQHEATVHQRLRFDCDRCGKRFTASGFRYHKLNAHLDRRPLPETPEVVVVAPRGLRGQEGPDLACHHCGKAFQHRRNLNKHVRTIHGATAAAAAAAEASGTVKGHRGPEVGGGAHPSGASAVKAHCCPHCPARFNRKDHADRHVTQVHSFLSAELFECTRPGCNKRFRSQVGLQQHVRLHDQRGVHPCLICGKTILRKKNLAVHVITHHQHQHQRPGRVPVEAGAGPHPRTMLPAPANDVVPKVPLKCLACDFTYLYPSKLADHLSSYPHHSPVHHQGPAAAPAVAGDGPNQGHDPEVRNVITRTPRPERCRSNTDLPGPNGADPVDLALVDEFVVALLSS